MQDAIRAGVWRCRMGFVRRHDSRKIGVRRGDEIPRDHPYSVMDGYEHNFVEVDHVDEPRGPFRVKGAPRGAQVEQATQAPGETHDRTVPQYNCEDCDRTFTTPAGLGRHRSTQHAEPRQTGVPVDVDADASSDSEADE